MNENYNSTKAIWLLAGFLAIVLFFFGYFANGLLKEGRRPIPIAACEPVGEAIAELTVSHNALVASQAQWYEHIEGEILRHERWLLADDKRIEAANSGHANILSAISSSEQRVMEELENWRNER